MVLNHYNTGARPPSMITLLPAGRFLLATQPVAVEAGYPADYFVRRDVSGSSLATQPRQYGGWVASLCTLRCGPDAISRSASKIASAGKDGLPSPYLASARGVPFRFFIASSIFFSRLAASE